MNLSLSTELYGTIVHRCDSGATIRLVDVSDVIVQILHVVHQSLLEVGHRYHEKSDLKSVQDFVVHCV